MEVSIIILTKNAGDRFNLLLDRIYSQKFEHGFEIVIIDSGSNDGTLEMAKRFKTKIQRIKPQEFHHAGTRNLGAELSSGYYLVYITQDAIPVDNQWLAQLIKPLKDKEVAAVYGRQIAHKGAKPMDAFFYSYFYPGKRVSLEQKDVGDAKTFYLRNIFISDVNSAMRKGTWEEIKFSEDLPWAEDKDFAFRALKAGYKIIYEPEAMVYHSHSYSISSLFRRRFKDGIGFSLAGSLNNKSTSNKGRFITMGLKYWWDEIRFLVKNGYGKWLPYAIIYDLTFFLAFELGKREKYLPSCLKAENQ